MSQVFYFVNIRYLPPLVFGLPIEYQEFLAPAFFDPQTAMGFRDHLVDIMVQEMNKIDRKRDKSNKIPLFDDFSREKIEEWIEIDQRFLAEMRE